MNPQDNPEHNIELPKPTDGSGSGDVVETAPAAAEQHFAPSSTPDPAVAQSTQDDPIASAVPPPTTSSDATAAAPVAALNTGGLAAEDADLIEKEWVARAKEIVAHTHGDPYSQNKEMSKIKADYIKKRYNKDIKQPAE